MVNLQTKQFWKVSNPVCSLLYMSFHFIAIPLCYAQCPANWESSAQNLDVQSWPKKNCFWYKISGNYLVKVIQLFFTVDIFAVCWQSKDFKASWGWHTSNISQNGLWFLWKASWIERFHNIVDFFAILTIKSEFLDKG